MAISKVLITFYGTIRKVQGRFISLNSPKMFQPVECVSISISSFVFLQVSQINSTPGETISHLIFSGLLAVVSSIMMKLGNKWVDSLNLKRRVRIRKKLSLIK